MPLLYHPGMSRDLCFLCAVDEGYEHFVAPSIASAAITYPECAFEVIFTQGDKGIDRVERELAGVRKLQTSGELDVEPLLRRPSPTLAEGRADIIRFLEVPKIRRTYTYITDVDVIYVVPELVDHCTHHMPSGLPYFNSRRVTKDGVERHMLTGLHFVVTEPYYSVIERDVPGKFWPSYISRGHDERILYQMCSTLIGLPPEDYTHRPMFGSHLTPSVIGKSDEEKAQRYGMFAGRGPRYLSLMEDPRWHECLPYFSQKARDRIEDAHRIARNRYG